jgi:glycosyltransferase involved in cell wall biosynthesis
MRKRIKILHILWTGQIGGAEEYVTSLLKVFDHTKYEIHLCFLSTRGPIYEDASSFIDNVKIIGMHNSFNLASAVRFLIYVYKGNFNIIHSHSRNFLATAVISLFLHTPKIITHHLSPGDKNLHKRARQFYKLYSKTFKAVTVISYAARESLINDLCYKYPDRIAVIHNRIDMNKFDIRNNEPPSEIKDIISGKHVFGFVGRMQHYKRPWLFIEIARELLRRDKNNYFVMVGDGPLMMECKDLIKKYDLSTHFKVFGFRRDIPRIMKSFDALLFTSDGEGFGLVLLEAMAMGVIVFATKNGAVPEIVEHGKSGFLMETDNPKEIAQNILRVMKDKDLMTEVKKQCVNEVRTKFSIQRSVRQMEDIYESLVEG